MAKFASELMDYSNDPDEILTKIKDFSYWRINIRPLQYINEKINTISECRTIIEELQVKYRGWYFPHINRNEIECYINGSNYIGNCSDYTSSRKHRDYWRFYQSGQFLYYFTLKELFHKDEITEKYLSNLDIPDNYEPKEFISIFNTLYLFVEIFEFARRLTLRDIYNSGINISIGINNIKNSILFSWDEEREFYGFYHYDDEVLEKKIEYSSQEIISKNNELILETVKWFFDKYRWNDFSDDTFIKEIVKLREGGY